MAMRAWAGVRGGRGGPHLCLQGPWAVHLRLLAAAHPFPRAVRRSADPLGFNQIDGDGDGVRDGHLLTDIRWC